MTGHPLQVLLSIIWDEGHTPQISVDDWSPEVIIPNCLRGQNVHPILIDLDAGKPLNLEFSETGLSVDLEFQGQTSRCFFPYRYIVTVLDAGAESTRQRGSRTSWQDLRGIMLSRKGSKLRIAHTPMATGFGVVDGWAKGRQIRWRKGIQ